MNIIELILWVISIGSSENIELLKTPIPQATIGTQNYNHYNQSIRKN